MLALLKIMIILKIVKLKKINGKVKKRFNPYNLLSYICVFVMFFIFLLSQIYRAIIISIKTFCNTDLFKYH